MATTSVPGSVTKQKLIELLNEASECEWLDYKETLDPTSTPDLLKLAKHIGAMQVKGGYIVVGADSLGRPSPLFTLTDSRNFDEADLRKKLARWLPEPFTLRSAVHEIDGNHFVLIRTEANPRLCMFKENGSYQQPGGKPVWFFRKGDWFVRRGSSSEKGTSYDHDDFIRQRSTEAADQVPAGASPTANAMPTLEAETVQQPSRALALEKINHVLRMEYDIDFKHITPGATLAGDLHLGRPELLELIMAVEEVLGLDLPDETFVGRQFTTIADLDRLFTDAQGGATARRHRAPA